MPDSACSVVLVDSHLISRQGVRALMERDPSLELRGDCATGAHAVGLCSELTPDVVVMSADADPASVAQAIVQLRCIVPAPGVVVVGTSVSEELIRSVFEAGASACLVGDAGYERLSEAIHAVAAGEVVIDVFRICDATDRGGAVMQGPSALSLRETQVLSLIAAGMATKSIAAALNLSPKTIETHRSNLYRKLEMRSVVELTKFAMLYGLTNAMEPNRPAR